MSEINMRGLRQVLQKFEENGRSAFGTHWHIANGGYDLWWELYYDRRPVIGCVDGCVENYCLPKDILTEMKVSIGL